MTLSKLVSAFFDYLRVPPAVQAIQSNNEIRDEIEFHLRSSVIDKMESGLDQQQSQKLALERFGDVNEVLHRCSNTLNARPMFFHRLHLCTTLGLVVVVGLLSYYMMNRSAETPPTTDGRLSVTATGYSTAATFGDIQGSVVDDRGQAVDSANVLAVVKTWPPNGFRQQSYMTTTRPDGSFAFDNVYAPGHEYEVQVAVIAEGHLLTSEYIKMTTGHLEKLCFSLQETQPFNLRFESGDGQPIEGVSAFPSARIDGDGNQHSVYFSSADPIVRKSDLAGKLSMPHFLPGDRATIYVRFPDSDWQTRELIIPERDGVVVVTPVSVTESTRIKL